MLPDPQFCGQRIIRVFPRRTKATPTDRLVAVDRPPGLFDQADEVHVSVTFDLDDDLKLADRLVKQWKHVGSVKLGGPALGDPGGEFTPGLYLKPGYVITSRGCPNRCWFCRAWKHEGNLVRELAIHDGWSILDNNLLACSRRHQEAVFAMLARQRHLPRFTGGLEATRLTAWHVEQFRRLKPETLWFAYDLPEDLAALEQAAVLLRAGGFCSPGHETCCYVLCGFPGDTIHAMVDRCVQVVRLGFFPQAMLLDKGKHVPNRDLAAWITTASSWCNRYKVGRHVKELRRQEAGGSRPPEPQNTEAPNAQSIIAPLIEPGK